MVAQSTDDYRKLIGITQSYSDALRDNRGSVAEAIDYALDEFYGRVGENEEASSQFLDKDHMQSAKARQQSHWTTITAGEFGEEFVQNATAVGDVHARINLDVSLYVCGYASILSDAIAHLIPDEVPAKRRKPADLQDLKRTVIGVVQAALLDMAMVTGVFLEKKEEERQQAEAKRLEMESEQNDAIAQLASALRQLAEKDLTQTLPEDMPGAFSGMAVDTNAAIKSLATLIGSNKVEAVKLLEQTKSVKIATGDLSERTERQAVGLEETAATMQQITDGIASTADMAKSAANFSNQSREQSDQGEVVLADALAAMTKLTKSSEEISNIVAMIDNISFQTNLLALNASVEAARAGDAGRGFAVVAQEVRALSQRCASAAEDITKLVDESGALVQSGVHQVEKVGESLVAIRERIGQADEVIKDISSIASDQSQNVREVNTAVADLDEITQQNAAMADRTNQNITVLAKQMENLASALNSFKTEAVIASDVDQSAESSRDAA